MKFRQKIMVLIYPLMMKILKLTGMDIRIVKNENNVSPTKNFYALKAILNNGEEISFEKFRNKKLLVVNLASECGFTPQYKELEVLNKSAQNLIILGFPSNDFKNQEPGNDEEILNFCRKKYGITFLLFKKNPVTGKLKQPVYQWLSDKNKNGWNDQEPKWNFYKFLIDEKGKLSAVFPSAVSPLNIKI